MHTNSVTFSILEHAEWAPGLTTQEAWAEWALTPTPIAGDDEPAVRAMAPMLRRRAGQLGKMALEVGYKCLGEHSDIVTVFCSRHGEVERAVALLSDLASGAALSPTHFSMSVHNASAGLFSIARIDRANHIALAAGASSLEHAVIEACGLLADGAAMVLLVVCECPLPAMFAQFDDCAEQPHAFAWLMAPGQAASPGTVTLSWNPCDEAQAHGIRPPSLDVLRFYLGPDSGFERSADRRRWRWARHA